MKKWKIDTDQEYYVVPVVERWCPGCGMTFLQPAKATGTPFGEGAVAISGHGFRIGDRLTCENDTVDQAFNTRMFMVGWN